MQLLVTKIERHELEIQSYKSRVEPITEIVFFFFQISSKNWLKNYKNGEYTWNDVYYFPIVSCSAKANNF